ncbi:MAG TPA: S8 family peptidase [Verrucomicrobiae bacterium]
MQRPIAMKVFGIICFWLLSMSAVFAETNSQYRTDQILIQPKAGISRTTLAVFHAAHGAKVRRAFDRIGGTQVIALPAGETVAGFIAKYQQSGLVEYAEPDYLVHADATLPNDPKFVDGTLWALDNYGQNGGTPHADIDATEAWDVLTSASNIVVAVLDSGIRATHEDLAANMWVNPNDGGNGFNAFDGTNDPSDDSTSHGTMVAGVLGAVGNNGKGVTGVAWQVQMMACKCLNNGTGSDSTVIACIDYAEANGAKIINASFDSPTFSQAVSNAIITARDAGIIWVASAGNGNPGIDIDASPTYPACYAIDNIISVAYTTRTDALGTLSNFGATNVDLAAPGDQIYTTFAATDSYYYPPSGLAINLAGTSFSAAYVSGALALMLAKYPTENYQQIIQRLLNATDPLTSLAGKCVTGGRLNLKNALNPPIWLSSAGSNNSGMFQLHLATGANRQCVIQMSTDLTSWTSIYTNTTSTSGTFDFTNTISSPQRFFRATTTL